MSKPSFLGATSPFLVDMIMARRPVEIEGHIRTGIQEGADAFGLQMEELMPEYRNEKALRSLFSYLADRPLYLTNYRSGCNQDRLDDGQRMDELKVAIRCGATLVDLTADTFAPASFELTRDAAAIDRQRKVIDEFHDLGGEVLMSSHVLEFRRPEEVLEIALEQQRRGADIVKIVTFSGSEGELESNFDALRLLRHELSVPFLFLSNGPFCRLHRTLGPYFGSCMWLCVDEYTELSSRNQPLLRSMAAVVRNLDHKPNRV